jgi:diguanylate cyclase (GGDEF)-like protein
MGFPQALARPGRRFVENHPQGPRLKGHWTPADSQGIESASNIRASHLLMALSVVLLLLLAVREKIGVAPALDTVSARWIYPLLIGVGSAACFVKAGRERRERRIWALMGGGLAFFAGGALYHTLLVPNGDVAVSAADTGHLAFFPLAYASLLLLTRRSTPGVRRAVWLDGLIGALATASVAIAVALHLVGPGQGTTPGALALGLAYPLGDALLLATAIGAIVLAGRHADATWALILWGMALLLVTDLIHLYTLTVDYEVYRPAAAVGWPAAAILFAFAAWQPRKPPALTRTEDPFAVVVPTIFAVVSLGVIVFDHFRPVYPLALGLAVAALVAVIVRMAYTFLENVRITVSVRRESLRDQLTGLGNRNRLVADLGASFAAEEPVQHLLLLLEVHGLKDYNDAFGRPAADALLRRLATDLHAALEPAGGTAYRLAGGEFAAFAPIAGPVARDVARGAVEALTNQGESFSVDCSFGGGLLPHEAADTSHALRLADQRLVAAKQARAAAANSPASEALARALARADAVSELVVAFGKKLGLVPAALAELDAAARLHDVGKTAIPDAILAKPESLDDAERKYVEWHTVIGERMLAGDPKLASVAKVVRASHERWDGTGYPDGIAGREIPLGARIIALADAWHAMRSDRPYRDALPLADAVAELRSCAGTQFDPDLVDVFFQLLAERQPEDAVVLQAAS